MAGTDSPRRRARSLQAIGCGVLALLCWLANLIELTLLQPHACSIHRMQLESYLLMARPAALLLSLVGLLLAAYARGENPRLRAIAVLASALGVAIVVACVAGWAPDMHLPCVRG